MKLRTLFTAVMFMFFFMNFKMDNENIPIFLDNHDTEVGVKIEAARIDETQLQIAWIVEKDTIDFIDLEITNLSTGVTETLRVYSLSGTRIIPWDGTTQISIVLKIKSTKTVQYGPPACDSLFCIEDIDEEIVTDPYIIDKIPVLPEQPPVVEIPYEILPEQPVQNNSNIDFTNPLITTIPMFQDIDFSNQQKNAFAFLITSMIIFLFYGVLLAQEWFNKIIQHYRVKWTSRKKELGDKTRLEVFMEISLIALITSLLYAFVEEGFTFSVEPQNLAIFIGVLVGLVIVTFFYEGVEAMIEFYVHNQVSKFDWNPQAMFFAILSTILFIVIDLPFGFILGFIASIHIISNRETAELSPKFYSMMSLSIVGYLFFFATSFDSVQESGFLIAICKLTYLMCLEGVIFKAVPWGGNELFDAIGDSKGTNQAMPIISFLIGIWLFIRILVLPPDSEFRGMQESLIQSGALAYRFAFILICYILIIVLLGKFMKKYAELNQTDSYIKENNYSDTEIKDMFDEELEQSFNDW